MTNYDSIKQWRHNMKRKLFEAFGGKCGTCGCVDHPVIYDFHHVDPTLKDFTLTSKIRSWPAIVKEAVTCVMLCAPCHRKFHAGLIELPLDIKRFDESLINVKETTKPCAVCTNRIPLGRTTCSNRCSAVHRFRVDWDSLDLKSLLVEHKNPHRLGQFLGVSGAAVAKRLRRNERISMMTCSSVG